MNLPDPVKQAVESAVGSRVFRAENLAGGQVSPAARVDTAEVSVFVKWDIGSEADRFALEADGLRTLAATKTLPVPRIIAAGYAAGTREQLAFGYLILEFIPAGAPKNPGLFSTRFAEGLADLHHVTAAANEPFGLDYNNLLGSQLQRNRRRSTDWAEFYRQNRLLPQIERAKRDDLLPNGREQRLMGVVERLDEIFDGLPSKASLIHGDLWSGNFLCAAGDEPVLIDPAIYYAPREMEIAYIELFGGFPSNFVENYSAVYPLDSEYPHRRSIHQLYPLLIHLNHFGEEYGPAVDRVCAEYLSG